MLNFETIGYNVCIFLNNAIIDHLKYRNGQKILIFRDAIESRIERKK